jgi:hypothetical protein
MAREHRANDLSSFHAFGVHLLKPRLLPWLCAGRRSRTYRGAHRAVPSWRLRLPRPKLKADLHLVFEQIKIGRGMEGHGWFANVIFHDKDEAKKQCALDFWFKPEGQDLKLMDIRVQKGPKQEGDCWIMVTHAGCLAAIWRSRVRGR